MTNKWINTENSLPETFDSVYGSESLVYQVLDADGFIKTAIYAGDVDFWIEVDVNFCDGVYSVNNRLDSLEVFAYCELPIVDESISNRLHKEFHKYDA